MFIIGIWSIYLQLNNAIALVVNNNICIYEEYEMI